MLVHFFHRNVRDTVIIFEEGKPTVPRYDIMVPWCALNGRHLVNAQFSKEAEREQRWLVEEDLQESLERAFQAYGEPLETVTLFKYLGRVLTVGGEDWL